MTGCIPQKQTGCAATKTIVRTPPGMYSLPWGYPVTPGAGQYATGSPLFNSVTLKLENGNTFTIRAKGNGSDDYYINDASLN